MDYFSSWVFFFDVVATTIGIVLAFVIQFLNGRRMESNAANNLKKKIRNELEAIYIKVYNIHTSGSHLLLTPIRMPVYHGAVNSLKIVLLSKYDWYEEILDLYETLETYNSWHDIKTSKTLDNVKHLSEVSDMLVSIEKELIGDVGGVNLHVRLSDIDVIEEAFKDDLDKFEGINFKEREHCGEIGNIILKIDNIYQCESRVKPKENSTGNSSKNKSSQPRRRAYF
ncbi:MAG: hypothetical protein FWB80_13390 [Defluviitaleaceae bacterium]|nr:hypothetical protein [Defluviitaleaceae bacterium]